MKSDGERMKKVKSERERTNGVKSERERKGKLSQYRASTLVQVENSNSQDHFQFQKKNL